MKSNDLYIILQEKTPSEIIKAREDEVFELIPELKLAKGFNQNNPWHIYDVYNHILHVVDYVPNDLNLRIAALFHDIGKPFTYSVDEKGIGHFKNHYVDSLNIFLKYANNNHLDIERISSIAKLIYFHDFRFKNDDNTNITKLVDSFTYDELVSLYELKKADLLAQNSEFHYMLKDIEEQRNLILERYRR